jgi:hypothetical protein
LAAARIYEFQIFGDPSTNLAKGKTATSSTTCGSQLSPANAVDGTIVSDVFGSWCSGVAAPWLKVDLGATALIERVAVKKAGVNARESTHQHRRPRHRGQRRQHHLDDGRQHSQRDRPH